MFQTVKLFVQIFRIRPQNNITCVKYITTSFKKTAITFLEETLEYNICHLKSSSNMLKNVVNSNPVITSTSGKDNATPLIDLEKIKKKEDLNIFTDFLYKQSVHVLKQSTNTIDEKCCNLLDVMSYYDIFKLLFLFTKTTPSRIGRMNFYNKVVDLLRVDILNKVFNKEEIILCIYFIGLTKKRASNDVKMILGSLEFEKLSLYETCIIAETAYKCGVKLSQTQIKNVEKLIESEAKTLVAETTLLTPLCKVLRHAGLSRNFLPNNLTKEIINKEDQYQMIAAVHILLLYKEIYLAEPTVLQRLVTDIMARISLGNQRLIGEQNLYINKIYQPKYIDGFLWSICMLNQRLTDAQLLEIRIFLNNIQFFLFLKPKELLRILLSLWILGYQPESMIQECIKRNIFLHVRNSKFWKLRSSLYLLLTVIRIESPEMKLHINLVPEIYVKLNIPKSVKIVSKIISGLSKIMNFQNVVINSPAEGIYIAGISFDHSTLGSFHMDLLNDITCLRFQKIPHGLMNLKLRLLKKLGYQSILIDEDDVKNPITAVEYIEKRLQEILHSK